MGMRPIEPLALHTWGTAGIKFDPAPTDAPKFAWAAPTDLLIDEDYQRNISKESLRLIKKIAMHWDWRHYTPPEVVEVDCTLHCIDGQHTAIGAATRGVASIPVMVVEAATLAERAAAFVGKNRDRLAMSRIQIFYASIAAQDEDAMTVDQVCRRAGVNIVRFPPAQWQRGDTMALLSIEQVVRRRFAIGARKVLDPLVAAGYSPITANQIKAVECLLYEDEYRGDIRPEKLLEALQGFGAAELEREAKMFAAAHNVRTWRGMAVKLYQRATKGLRKAA